jgi:Flp pilus assembly protein TadG
MRRIAQQQTLSNRRGGAALELALTLPVLLLLAFGCVDMGRAASAHLIVCNAARTGADYGATRAVTTISRAAWEDSIRTEVETEMLGIPSFNDANLTVNIETVAGHFDLDHVIVTVQYNFQTITGWPGIPQNISLEHTVSTQRFR